MVTSCSRSPVKRGRGRGVRAWCGGDVSARRRGQRHPALGQGHQAPPARSAPSPDRGPQEQAQLSASPQAPDERKKGQKRKKGRKGKKRREEGKEEKRKEKQSDTIYHDP